MVAPHKSRLVPATSTKDENQITAKMEFTQREIWETIREKLYET
jgi:hypothetical protein